MLFFFSKLIIKGLERSWCVTLKNACSNPPLRLHCTKVHFSGCDAALYWIYKRSRSPPLPSVATRASDCTRTLSHWHMDGTQAMSKGLKPSGPESHTSIVLVASHRCRTLQQLSTSSSFFFPSLFFFFFLLNLSHGLLLSPSSCEMVDESTGRFAPLYHGSCYAVWL